MKTILSCDQVFETLTRGPFPTGSPDDDGVEMHLTGCHECRCLAEALRPAATLFHESLSATEQESLPAYDGLLARLTHEVIGEAPPKANEPPVALSGNTIDQVMRFGTAMLFGLSLCLILVVATSGFVALHPQPHEIASLPIVRTAYHPQPDRLAALACNELKTVCFPSDWQAAIDSLACCSQCHAPGSSARAMCKQTWNHACTRCHQARPEHSHAPRLFAVLQQSCAACHDS